MFHNFTIFELLKKCNVTFYNNKEIKRQDTFSDTFYIKLLEVSSDPI